MSYLATASSIASSTNLRAAGMPGSKYSRAFLPSG
jgi:hypothetical protein